MSRLDSEQPLASIETIDDRLNTSVSRPRFTADLLFAFSCAGVLLSLMGVYGVLSCRAQSQVRELAVRQALGATPRDVVAHMLWHAFRFVLAGVGLGLIIALPANRLISNLLFRVKPDDPATLALVCGSILLAAFFSSLVPAVRAARLDPLKTLRQD